MRKRVLISTYCISPYKGSEFSAAWNMVMNLSRKYDLWVLYGSSDEHMGDTATLRSYVANNDLKGVTFIEINAGSVAHFINYFNKLGFGWCFYIAYRIWQRECFRVATKVVSENHIDVVHQFGLTGFREPGFLWRIGKPSVWGPIAGTKLTDLKLLPEKNRAGRLKFYIKNLLTTIQFNYSQNVSEAFAKYTVLLGGTIQDKLNIEARFNRSCDYFPEQGVLKQPVFDANKFRNIASRVDFVWSGSLIDRKNLTLALNAFSEVSERHDWVLHVLGSGPLESKLKGEAELLGIAEKVVWHGHIERERAIEVMRQAHVHLITSIAEGNPAVLFEAMSYGIPTIALDHCGPGDVLTSECAVKVPVDGFVNVRHTFAEALDSILDNRDRIVEMSKNTCAHAWKYMNDPRLEEMDRIYARAIDLYHKSDANP